MQSQLVAYGCCHQVHRRHLSLRLIVGTHRHHRAVRTAIHLPVVHVEIIATDAVKGRCRTRIDAGMSDCRDRRHIVDQTVIVAVTFVNEATETTLAKLLIIARQIVPAHLVHHNAYHQLRTLAELGFVTLCRQLHGTH